MALRQKLDVKTLCSIEKALIVYKLQIETNPT
jgi:hypothetical protein